jgi:hypothetical protein
MLAGLVFHWISMCTSRIIATRLLRRLGWLAVSVCGPAAAGTVNVGIVDGEGHALERVVVYLLPTAPAAPALQADVGHAWTVAYRYSHSARLTGGVEWVEIESRRDLWPLFYSAPHEATESQLRLLVSFNYGAPKTR